jgi:hypothetical protein
MPNPLLSQIAKYRDRLDRQSEADLERLISAYGRMSQRLKDKVDLLILELERDPAQAVKNMSRYSELVAALNSEFAKYNVYLETELERIAAAAQVQAQADAVALIKSSIQTAFPKINPKAVAIAKATVLAPDAARWARIHELAPLQAQYIIDKLLQGINLGWGYEKLGKQIVDALGLSLSDALRWARTVQMEAYRETSHATMEQNDYIDGWTWWAQLDEATCTGPGSCTEMHGTFHPMTERLSDLTLHIWNDRCVELPHVVGDENPVTGEPVESE